MDPSEESYVANSIVNQLQEDFRGQDDAVSSSLLYSQSPCGLFKMGFTVSPGLDSAGKRRVVVHQEWTEDERIEAVSRRKQGCQLLVGRR